MGPDTAPAYRTAVEDPPRFRKASLLGAHFGLTRRKYASGETDRNGRIRIHRAVLQLEAQTHEQRHAVAR
ncbi:MAG: transposase [Rhodobacteraceae bacterium]|nr:transposase [Paracoccaceae bacterium]